MNTITATISFDYKGEHYTPSVMLDLDPLMEQYGALPELYSFLATSNEIDLYSYQYEMMLAETVHFSHPQGFAGDFCANNDFDQSAFEQYWHEQKMFNSLAEPLKQQLDIDDINHHPALKSVINAAYQLGKKSK